MDPKLNNLSEEPGPPHLVKADRHIVDGERRVSAQVLLIERFKARGQDTGEAEQPLSTLQQTLRAWHDHRNLTLQEIMQLEVAPRD